MMSYQNYGCPSCQSQYYSGGFLGTAITESTSTWRLILMAPILIIGALILAIGIIAIVKRVKESKEEE